MMRTDFAGQVWANPPPDARAVIAQTVASAQLRMWLCVMPFAGRAIFIIRPDDRPARLFPGKQ
jgi:hypothetical protein